MYKKLCLYVCCLCTTKRLDWFCRNFQAIFKLDQGIILILILYRLSVIDTISSDDLGQDGGHANPIGALALKCNCRSISFNLIDAQEKVFFYIVSISINTILIILITSFTYYDNNIYLPFLVTILYFANSTF